MVWTLFSFHSTGFLFFFDGIVVEDDPQKKLAFFFNISPKEHWEERNGALLRNHKML